MKKEEVNVPFSEDSFICFDLLALLNKAEGVGKTL